jgi:hypothetical protein
VLRLPPVAAAAVALAVFAIGHLYQGWLGALGNAFIGAVLNALYLAVGEPAAANGRPCGDRLGGLPYEPCANGRHAR